MDVQNKLPLQSSNNFNIAAGKTIEQTYQKKTQLENILLRPDTYVGSIEKQTQTLWVYENDQMVSRSVAYVPGLYKIFDEILVNASDQKQRDPSMDSLKVVIDVEQNCISVENSGYGVPVEIHKEEGVYVPELIFGHLLTSSNYDDSTKKTTGGRNGYGAKLTNIFSTEFVIETADGKRQKKKYKQVFSNNMGKKSEPVITECNEGENWTKISFKPDLAKFKMTHLEDDVVALMKKRVIDLAGCLGKTVKVELNGQQVPVKSFIDYVDLYLQTASKNKPEPLPRIAEKVNERWEVCVSLSDWSFQQVSFVNGIATIRGGTHVDYITNQISNHMISKVNKKNKNATNLGANAVKNYLWVFVNALIDNPAFDSQTKETLITRRISFGSICEISQAFLKKVAKSGLVERLLSWAEFKQKEDLKMTDGIKKGRITGITKLEDANAAGGKDSHKCTLILTEGDSAKALAMAGISVVGRDYYGVFPLRGKLLNVREASHKQIMENAEIRNIKKILGLKQGKEYNSVEPLRYGHLMIMTDQDHDGSHIKGLLINFIHSFWPSLLKIPSFLVEFITPIVKATKGNRLLCFYSMPEYESWKDSLVGNASGWSIKYYKGLGTSTSIEGKEYFQDIEKHKKDFVWVDEQDGDAIELAFSKKKIEARKNWLRHFEPGTYLDQKEKLIKYRDFVNKELILFSMADLQRSIPSMVDGLKPGQRKILFCAFKRGLYTDLKVAQFSGYVSEHSAYHHGEQSLASTIIGMAQDYVGSNNINLFEPNGQFGTRHQGGKDHASPRYIYTRLSPMTLSLFPKDDDVLLDYLNEDGESIEPTWYMPIIPMVLVNGSEGIGTGWSSYIPNYNPRDIVSNVRHLLNGEPMEPMDPWYKGFRGTIEKTATKETGVSYTVSGIIEEVDDTTLRITELPIRKSTQDYKEFLESIMIGNDKAKEDPFIEDFREHNDDTTVHFEVILSEDDLIMAEEEGLLKIFKLNTTISTSNMHLFDRNGVIKKYISPEQILEEFFHIRLEFYEKRKKSILDNFEMELLELENKVRFISEVVEGEFILMNRKEADLFVELRQKGFTPFRNGTKTPQAQISNSTDDAEDYKYLLSMPLATLTLEKGQELCAKRDMLVKRVDDLRKATPKSLWMTDLDELERKLDIEEKGDGLAEEARMGMKSKVMNEAGLKNVKQAPKNPRKNNKASSAKPSAETFETSNTSYAMETDNVPEAGPKKAPAQKQENAYNLQSSQDHTDVMETEVPEVQAEAAAKEKQLSTAIEISSDEDFEAQQKYMLDNLEMELLKLNYKVRFIIEVVKEEIIVRNRKCADLFVELREKGFTAFRKITKTSEAQVSDATDGAKDYEYLLSMPIGTLTLEKGQELCAERENLNKQVDDLRKATPKSEWMNDTDERERKLDKEEKGDAQAEEARMKTKFKVMNEAGLKNLEQAPNNPQKNNKASSAKPSAETLETLISSAMEADNVPEAGPKKAPAQKLEKPPEAGPKKAPAQKEKSSPVLKDEEDNEEVHELKERLAAHNLESSPDHSEVLESEVPQVQAKAAAENKQLSTVTDISSDEDAAKKKQLSTITEISSDEDDAAKKLQLSTVMEISSDDDFEVELVAAARNKKKGRRKPANAKAAKPPAATRKRGLANKRSQVTEALKLPENSGLSPEKKVRKTRASSFNKKSSSVLRRIDEENISTASVEKTGTKS